MLIFNIVTGVATGLVVAIPLLFIKQKWIRMIVATLAVLLAVMASQVSERSFYPRYLGWSFEGEVKKEPLFSLIARYHPQEFKQFIDKVKIDLNQRGVISAIPIYSAQLVNHVFYLHLQNAPDDYIANYLKATIDLYHYLYALDPRAVIKLENGERATEIDLTRFFDDKKFQGYLKHLMDTKGYLIEASIKTPAKVPTAEQADPLIKEILTRLSTKYGDSEVKLAFIPAPSNISPNLLAQIIIDFYTEILNSGKDKSGIIMRHIGALKAQER